MLSTAIKYRDVLFRLSQWESSYKCIPKEEEWEMASSICERLTLFYKVTELFSGTLLWTLKDILVRKKKGGNIKLELEHYLEDDLMPRTLEFDILAWWKSNGPKYPTLQCIARDILAIPVSIVTSESAFSTSGRLLSPHRSKLHAKTVEALMCAQNWLWAEIKGNQIY